jgi:phytoene dehydrogenase-like protein
MNQRLGEHRIRATCRELIADGGRVSGRALRRELRSRFGAVGKTARVFQIWREESTPLARGLAPTVSPDVAQMQLRLHAAEAAAADHLARAQRAEFREQAHQEHWAMEIDRLREQLRAHPKYAAEIRALQEQVLRLSAELQATRTQLSRQE